MNVTQHKNRGNKNPLTITAAARILGVTRKHLSNAIHGHVKALSILKRYRALKRNRCQAASSASKLSASTPNTP